MQANKKTETEVMAVFNHFIDTYIRQDVEGTLALLAPDPDILLTGTGADEKIKSANLFLGREEMLF
jgi:hypothetical protein